MSSQSSKIATAISLQELFAKTPALRIPDFQRPYKWNTEQVKLMLNDIQESFQKKRDLPYMMGTVIVHPAVDKEGKDCLDIVDGQQRLTTLTLLVRALHSSFDGGLMSQKFEHVISQKNLRVNFQFIVDWLDRKSINKEEWRDYLNTNIQFVLVTARSLDQAFVFFDSQNTRGLELSDHDKLKAHHLRYIGTEPQGLDKSCVVHWESLARQKKDYKDPLGYLIHRILGRSRKWIRKEYKELDLLKEFQSQRTEKTNVPSYRLNRYQQPAVFAGWRFDHTAGEGEGLELITHAVDVLHGSKRMRFLADSKRFMPFQLPQALEGGEQFFWYVEKYHALYKELFQGTAAPELKAFRELYDALQGWRWSTGIGYLVEVYEAAMLFYYDKFGAERILEIGMWVEHGLFFMRHDKYAVRYAGISGFLEGSYNPFALINEAAFPEHIVSRSRRKTEELYEGIRQGSFKGNFNDIRRNFWKALYGDEGIYRGDRLPGVLPEKKALLGVILPPISEKKQ